MKLKTVTGMAMFMMMVWSVVFLAQAAPNGIYLTSASAHYSHPVTGEMEDSGKNPVVGQGMTESVLGKNALIEVDSNGNTFVTVRFALMDNIDQESVAFFAQKDAGSSFQSVSHQIMKENNQEHKTDFRFKIPSENAIVKTTFYVKPMGRNIIFYIDFNGLNPGSGDFITSVEVEEPKQEEPAPGQHTEQPAGNQSEPKENTAKTPVKTQEEPTGQAGEQETESQELESETQKTDTTTAQSQSESSPEQILEGVEGLTVYKNAQTDEGVQENNQKSGPGALVIAVIVVAVVALLCGAGWYISKSRRKK